MNISALLMRRCCFLSFIISQFNMLSPNVPLLLFLFSLDHLVLIQISYNFIIIIYYFKILIIHSNQDES
jgi:hypothetical protein